MLRAFDAKAGDTSSCLVVLGAADPMAWRSMRNFPRLLVRTADDVNAAHVLESRLVLLTEEAAEKLKKGRAAAVSRRDSTPKGDSTPKDRATPSGDAKPKRKAAPKKTAVAAS